MGNNFLLNVPEAINKILENYKIVIVPKDSQPVQLKHGYWIDVNGDGSLWRCSVCGETQCCESNYCGDCGTKMDEEREDAK